MRVLHFVPVLFLSAVYCAKGNEILGCGGFVKSHVPIDFSKVVVKLFTKQGILKDQTNCAPNNGYYFIPLYDKGDYVLKLEPPPGWSFTPTNVAVAINGKNDICSQGKDINFTFKGFGITGKVETFGTSEGPSDVSVELQSSQGIRTTVTGNNGVFFFTPVFPGEYVVKISHPRWRLLKDSLVVVVTEGNTELPPKSLIVSGYDVTGSVKSDGEPINNVKIFLHSTNDDPNVHVEGCENPPKGTKQEWICYVVSDVNGNFIFPSISNGAYNLVPFYKDHKIQFEPQKLSFSISHGSVKLDQAFEIIGFSISGKVLDSANGKPLSGATVKINNQNIGVTKSDGLYSLEKLKAGTYTIQVTASDYQFEPRIMKLNPSLSELPSIFPSTYKVCGVIKSDKTDATSIHINQVDLPQGFVVKLNPTTGEFCDFLKPGTYHVNVNVDQSDRSLQFYPAIHTIEVKSAPIFDITFSQLKAKVSAKINSHFRLKCVKYYNKCFYSSNKVNEVEIPFSNGRNLWISTGKYARMADGCAVATLGETSVMVTAVSKTKPTSNNFLPLVVDYRQKSAAAGRIPTNFLRRELGPSEREILISRLIDRSLRPLFPNNFMYETQIVCNMLAVDSVNLPDVISINAASAALALSDIPWNGPVGAVRVGLIDNEVIINPTRKELQASSLNLVVSTTKHNLVVMLEGNGNNVLQPDLQKAIKVAAKEAQGVIQAVEKLQKLCGKTKRELPAAPELSQEVNEALQSLCEMRISEIFRNHTYDKLGRDNAVNEVRGDVIDKIRMSFPDVDMTLVSEAINRIIKTVFRNLVFEEDLRCDGRQLDDLRDISCQVNMYKPLHGCSLFQRGQTQVFCTVSLDSPQSALKLDPMAMITSGVKEKNFFLHYEFPPFATKETGRMGPIGRREMGHGALAEKGLNPIVPSDYPFTIRLTSEVLESNGSSSMASVCAGSLALMDAGVPISAPAAGVAIGLMSKYSNNDTKHMEDYRILTDILGIEDYMGDMDFKVAGTRKGITALQADIKIPGVPLKIVMESIQKATDAKSKILDIMHNCIDKPRVEKKENLPVSQKLEVEAHKRVKLLGVGGINMKKLFLETGVQVNQVEDTTFEIFAPNQNAMDEAMEVITKLLTAERTPELEFGGVYNATVVEMRDIGVMVTLYPGMPPALLHNSQLDQRKVAHPTALGLEVGSEIQVKYFGRDPVSGLMRLSRKVLQSAPR